MPYPSLEQYNEAFQHPSIALKDPELKQGQVVTTGLGLPLALCGGFALTYTIKNGGKKYAVRCFHKQSNALEKRYSSISSRLASLRSPYFVDFEFQPQGIRVAGSEFPIVKMAWASGVTLGEFVENNYHSSSNLQNLIQSLTVLANYLEFQNMAHGDIQTGNVMVADAGNKLQLIDYDGMFVEDLQATGSSELGHRNFQHPQRSQTSWNSSLDRFAFISLNLSLRALILAPNLWAKSRSDGDSIIFKANDFANPSKSGIFSELISLQGLSEDAKNFASICGSPFELTPSLDDYLSKQNIPSAKISIASISSQFIEQYLSAFPVLDATNYAFCLGFVGDKVELIGKIIDVKQDTTRHGKPYVFINFGHWQGNIVKISIWSEGLEALTNKPSSNWVGKWISVVGLMEPPYVSRKYKYSHLSISITQGSQLHIISENDARYRLAGSSTRSAGHKTKTSNQDLLELVTGRKASTRTVVSPSADTGVMVKPSSSKSSNHDILEKMRSGQSRSPGQTAARPAENYQRRPQPRPSSNSNCFIATAVYGSDAFETNVLRKWRDSCLLTNLIGRIFVSFYYLVSPPMIPVLRRSRFLTGIAKNMLNKLVSFIVSRQ